MLLVNRRRDQTIEVFDELTWHGGEGSTLELRVLPRQTYCKYLLMPVLKTLSYGMMTYPQMEFYRHSKVEVL